MSFRIELTHTGRSSLSGQRQAFTQEVVRLGRRPENDVAFDPHLDAEASGYHAEIRATADGAVLVDIGSSNGTFVNDRRIEIPTPLCVGDRVRLASDGPEFTVSALAAADDVPPTLMATRAPPPAPVAVTGSAPPPSPSPVKKEGIGVETMLGIVDRATEKERRRSNVRLAVFAVVGLLVAGAAIYAATQFGGKPAGPAFVQKPAPPPEADAPSPTTDGADPGTTDPAVEEPEPDPPVVPVDPTDWSQVVADYEPSVYVIVERRDHGGERVYAAQGTAWVAGDGVLATNAHVAAVFLNRDKDTTVIARSVGPDPHDVEIVHATVHPAYAQFNELNARYRPFDGGSNRFGISVSTPFDVALLSVRFEDKKKLAPPLPIATLEQLRSVRAGTPAMTIGFPIEGKQGGGVDLSSPVASKDFKAITRRSDVFYANAASHETALSYMYSLNATGGASGSPVFARVEGQARVIGLIASGDVLGIGSTGARIVAGSTSYGPRVDLVTELLSTNATEQMAARTAWLEGEFRKRFKDGVQKPKRLAYAFAQRVLRGAGGRPPKLVLASDPVEAKVTTAGRAGAVSMGTFRAPVAGKYTVVVFAKDEPYFPRVQLRSGRAPFQDASKTNLPHYVSCVSLTRPLPKGAAYDLQVWLDVPTGFRETELTAVWMKFE